MALAENTSGQTQPEKPSNEQPQKQDKRDKPSTKVIVRRLPPGMTQDEFLTQVSPVPDYDYIYSVKGDASLGENSFSRVYLNFVNHEDIYIFKEKFDNYVFVDGKGHEYPAVVEYASFQKVPKRRKARPDPKIGSIESDPLYLEFLESLKEQPVQEEKPEYSYQPSSNDKNDVTTPLLDYLKQRKIDRLRIKEEKREERRKKEIERKKLREDDRRKRMEDKILAKNKVLKDDGKKDEEVKPQKEKDKEKEDKSEEHEKPSTFTKPKERKPSVKPKYSKYEEKKDFKTRRDEYRDYQKSKFEDGKKEFTKKVKKYSERREERKAEQKKEPEEEKKEVKPEIEDRAEYSEDSEHKNKNKENDPRMQRRIRNKDRPAMVLYKPGMLRKKSVDNDKDKDKDKEREKEMEVEKEKPAGEPSE